LSLTRRPALRLKTKNPSGFRLDGSSPGLAKFIKRPQAEQIGAEGKVTPGTRIAQALIGNSGTGIGPIRVLFLTLALLLPSGKAPAGQAPEQIFGILGDVGIYGNFGKASPWLYETDLLLVGNQIGTPYPAADQFMVFSAVGSYTSLGYKINEHHSLYAGYGFQHVLAPLASVPTNENRGWQQYNYEVFTAYGGFKLSTRLEERTVNNAGGLALRARQLVQWTYPLNDLWYLIAAEEVFFNLNTVSWGPVTGYDQNRVFAGIGYRFNGTTRAEIGYLNNFINRDFVEDLDVDFLTFNVYVDLTE